MWFETSTKFVICSVPDLGPARMSETAQACAQQITARQSGSSSWRMWFSLDNVYSWSCTLPKRAVHHSVGSLVHNDNKQRVTEEILFLREGRREVEAICPDFKHKNLVKLTIYGFQPDDIFVRFIRCVREHAVNMAEISLHDRKVCLRCGDLDPKMKCPSRYPRNADERMQIIEELGCLCLPWFASCRNWKKEMLFVSPLNSVVQ